jgi:mono/diheme cytochrome c family protein
MVMMRFSALLTFSVLIYCLPMDGADLVFHADFESKEKFPASSGGVQWDKEGPRPPRYPEFAKDNKAAIFSAKPAWLIVPEEGPSGSLRFHQDDMITLETWVRLDAIASDQNVYLLGKGRTHKAGFPQENQNYALRLRGVGHEGRPSFLFATNKNGKSAWHRWTMNSGFRPGARWHHVAVSYQFGKPDSIQGWLDGKQIDGTWDMDGPTTEAPVADADDLWIGASMGGHAGNSLRGALDETRIWRGMVPAKELAGRYHENIPPPPLPVFEETRIRVELFDNASNGKQWPDTFGSPTIVYYPTLMAFPEIPHRYDEWGIREDWTNAVLLRATMKTTLPSEGGRLLFRARGGARLYIDDQQVAEIPFLKGSTDGHQPVAPVPEEIAPGIRRVGYGDKERLITLPAGAAERTIRVEILVGGDAYRAEPGEALAALENRQTGLFHPLSFANSPPLTDSNWPEILGKLQAELEETNRQTRQRLAGSMDDFWKKRHETARQWWASQPPIIPPTPSGSWPVLNEIDQFLGAKAEKNQATKPNPHETQSAEAPLAKELLAEKCFRCHGEKEKGGLRLDTTEHFLMAGDSGLASVVPGKPAESLLVERIKLPAADDERMPPQGDPLTEHEVALLEKWIASGAEFPLGQSIVVPEPTPLLDDASFLRKLWLDTVGLFPPSDVARSFLADKNPAKRSLMIDHVLADPRWADHMVSYWQDVLAENPNILKPSLDNSGPFRFFLHEALLDNKPVDRWVTELLLMRGSIYQGGSAGFGMAADNDAPLAAKGHIIGSAFLGLQMKCARCHDSPYHSTTQENLFALAAMLDRKPSSVPKTSTVPASFMDQIKGRKPLIKVTLPPGQPVAPKWPFEEISSSETAGQFVTSPNDTRASLAALVTQPSNLRFAKVMVNRLWKQWFGTGFVEPVDDWEGKDASHPELLRWLAGELITHDYDLKHIARLILNSHAWQRQASPSGNAPHEPETRFFAGPDHRRIGAEQMIDSLFHATGLPLAVEPLTFDLEALRPAKTMINLGQPQRAWEMASLSNERDRPSLNLPKAQAVTSLMEVFGWRSSRAEPLSCRETDPNLLQPGTLANGVPTTWLTRLVPESGLTTLAMEAETPEALIEELFLRYLSRPPTAKENAAFLSLVGSGFATRVIPADKREAMPQEPLFPAVSWSNHLNSEANRIILEREKIVRAGNPATTALDPAWRESFEDAVWALINSPEVLFQP